MTFPDFRFARRITLVALCAPMLLSACVVHRLTNAQGVEAPCKGGGLAGPAVVDYCVARFQEHGFVSEDEVGSSGLSIGIADERDGVVTGVAAGSPAAQAGIAVGDEIVAVGGKPTLPAPAELARRVLFGSAGKPVQVSFQRDAKTHSVVLVRAPQPANIPDPTPSSLVSSYPMIDADGRVVPCFAAGVAVAMKASICEDYFGSRGYVYTANVGSVGLSLDDSRKDAAIVARVEAGQPADRAGLQAGDALVQLDGRPLAGGRGRLAQERLFGRAGTSVQVTYRRGGENKTVTLTLVKP